MSFLVSTFNCVTNSSSRPFKLFNGLNKVNLLSIVLNVGPTKSDNSGLANKIAVCIFIMYLSHVIPRLHLKSFIISDFNFKQLDKNYDVVFP